MTVIIKTNAIDYTSSFRDTNFLFWSGGWSLREDYTGDYKYQCTSTFSIQQPNNYKNVTVIFNEEDATSGNFSPVCDWSYNKLTREISVTIYAKTPVQNYNLSTCVILSI